jgi:hypothetical protein
MKKLTVLFILILQSCIHATDQTKVTLPDESKNINGCWTDFRIGELPPLGYYYAMDSLVKKWDLCYTREESGCEVNDSIRILQQKYKASNEAYFESLKAKLGNDWKQKFDKEYHILDSINWIKINKTIESLNNKN